MSEIERRDEATTESNVETILWHATWAENVGKIQTNGFSNNEHGFVWFSPPGDTYWRIGDRVILEVVLDIADDDLEARSYKSVSVDEDETCEPHRINCQVTYKIPAEFVNAHKKTIGVVT